VTVTPRVLPEGSALDATQAAALEAGTRDVLGGGPLEGAPVEDTELVVEEVELYGPASSPEALRAAASRAAVKALGAAGGVVLRPIMATEVVVPAASLGTVLGDLQARQAVILGTETQGEAAAVQCEVALDRLLGYATELRSLTQGRGQFSMVFRRFDTA
jgi:elongation factor G